MDSKSSIRRPVVSRACVSCACGFNWLVLVLIIFATASGYWSWGNSLPNSQTPVVATASIGPWFAGSLWSTYPVPCNCANGFCYSWCYVGSQPVRWGEIPAEAACVPNSVVYREWSGPLGYCEFPDGVPPPPPDSTPTTDNATGEDFFGSVPSGTVFNSPSEATAIQGLMITACIVVFIAAVAGCVDAGSDSGSMIAGVVATFMSLAGFVFILASYCLWSAFPFVQGLQASSPSNVWVPVWINPSLNQMTAVPVANFDYGPGWATALTASIVVFFCFVAHCLSLFHRSRFQQGFPTPYGENVTPNPPPGGAEPNIDVKV